MQDISGKCMRVVINWVEDRPVDIPYLLGKKIHGALQESELKKVRFIFPGTLQKIVDFCRPNGIETNTGDINQHENIYWPKPPIHKTYYRKYNSMENNDELSGQPPK